MKPVLTINHLIREEAKYDEATRTITLTAQKNLVSGNEYTVVFLFKPVHGSYGA